MRRRQFPRINVNATLLAVFILLLFSTFIASINVTAQEEEKLDMDLCIWDHEIEDYMDLNESFVTFFEGKNYDIDIWHENEDGGPETLYGVTIELPWGIFVTGPELEYVPIQTPSFEEYSDFIIKASKEGYTSVEKFVIVMKGKLTVTADCETVQEEEVFSVTVIDQDGTEIRDSVVYIKNHSDSSWTNEDGIAYLSAPNTDEENITIMAYKLGYDVCTVTIGMENILQETIFSEVSLMIPENILSTMPIFFAIIVLISAILFVRFRKKTSRHTSDLKTDMLSKKNRCGLEKKDIFTRKNMTKDKSTCRNEPDGWDAQAIKDEPRVEEIRIHTSGKKKETACLSTECEEQPRKAISPKSRDSEWFKGTDDIKYKIDKITGEIDENGADKWFEGVDNIKSKIDEKVSKKIKKKNRQIN